MIYLSKAIEKMCTKYKNKKIERICKQSKQLMNKKKNYWRFYKSTGLTKCAYHNKYILFTNNCKTIMKINKISNKAILLYRERYVINLCIIK